MALSNYSELKQSVISWLHRGDLDLLVDDFIMLAENDIYAGLNALRVKEMMSASDIVTGVDQFISLPTGYLESRSLRIKGVNGGELRYKVPQSLIRRTGTGRPAYFTVTDQIELDVVPDQAYTIEINYYQQPATLSDANPTNAILTKYPALYLYSTLSVGFIHSNDEEQAGKYKGLLESVLVGANQADMDASIGPAPYARVSGATP